MTLAAPIPTARPIPAARRPILTARPPVALYVHVPFCVSICPYCDFVVYPGSDARGPRNRMRPFVTALRTEIAMRAAAVDARFGRHPLASVYVGGGTPSLLPFDDLAAVLDAVRGGFGIAAGAEVTLEVNPGRDERGDASAWREAGVSRLSIGAQSLEPRELRRLGRRHTPDDVAAAVTEAREAGIGSVSLDLLYDLPASTVVTWARTLDAAVALRPDHLSLYALTLDDPDAEGLTGALGDHLPTRPGARRWRMAAAAEQDDDRAAEQYRHAVDRLAADGWRGYEISNWARPGHESRHNRVYWERRPYEAVGPGAHAFDGLVRRWNAAGLDGYLRALAPRDRRPPTLPPGGEDGTDATKAAAERLVLALRTDRGVPVAAAALEPLAACFDWARNAGLVAVTDAGRIVLTTRGRLLSNELFARLV